MLNDSSNDEDILKFIKELKVSLLKRSYFNELDQLELLMFNVNDDGKIYNKEYVVNSLNDIKSML